MFVFLALILAALGLTASSAFSIGQIVLALFIIAVSALPLMLTPLDPDRGRYPLFPLSCLFYGVCFGLPLFLAPLIWPEGVPVTFYALSLKNLSAIAPVELLGLILAGLVLYILAFHGVRAFAKARLPVFQLREHEESSRLILLLWLLLAGSLSWYFIPLIHDLPSIGQFLIPAGFVSFAVFFMLWMQGKLPRLHVVSVFFIVLPVWGIKIVLGSLVTPIMLTGILFFLLLLSFAPRKALGLAIVAALLLTVVNQASYIYRAPVLPVPLSKLSYLEQSKLLARALTKAWDRPFLSFTQTEIQNPLIIVGPVSTIAKRISLLPLMSVVYEKTPDPVPYWSGDTYKPFLTSFVPRVFWSGKPEERSGRRFALRYGLDTAPGQTSVNIPWIIEMIANFGMAGVLGGMALAGAFFAFLDRFFNSAKSSMLASTVGLGLIFPLVYQESNFSLMTGSLLPATISFYLYFSLGLKQWRGQRPSQ